MMKKLVMSEEKDLWYCLTDRQSFQFSLLINAQPAKNVSLWDFCLDGKGKPHLYLVTKQELECYFWDGLTWKAKSLPLILDPTSIYSVFREGIEQHFLVSVAGNKSYQHYLLTDRDWEKREVSFLDESVSIVAFIPWGKDLALIHSAQSYSGNCLNVIIYEGIWKTKQKINVGTAKFYSMVQGSNELLMLFGEEKVTGSWLKILRIPYNESGKIEEHCCTVKGCMGRPAVFLVNDVYKICWTERGKIYLASLDLVNYQVTDILESDVFFPVELISLSGKGAGYLALSIIYGTKLDFPLVLRAEDFEKMVRAHNLHKETEDHPGLNCRFFSRVGYSGNQERKFCK